MNKYVLFTMICLAILVAGCGPNPIDTAEARRIDAMTEQDVRDREQMREFNEAGEARAAEREAAAVEREIQREAEEEARWSRLWEAVTAGATAAAGVAAFLVVLALGIGTSVVLVGLGQATREAALLRANLIPLDRATRQYPLLRVWRSDDGRRLTALGSGRYLLANPNDGSVATMDVRQEADAQKVAGMISAWDAGIVAEAAKAAKDSNSDGIGLIASGAARIVEASSRSVESRD